MTGKAPSTTSPAMRTSSARWGMSSASDGRSTLSSVSVTSLRTRERRSSWWRLCWGFPLRRLESRGAIAVRKPGGWELSCNRGPFVGNAVDVECSAGNQRPLAHHRQTEVAFRRSFLDVESFSIIRDGHFRSLGGWLQRDLDGRRLGMLEGVHDGLAGHLVAQQLYWRRHLHFVQASGHGDRVVLLDFRTKCAKSIREPSSAER